MTVKEISQQPSLLTLNEKFWNDMRVHKLQQEKALVQKGVHQASNADRQSRSGWCCFRELVLFCVMYSQKAHKIGIKMCDVTGAKEILWKKYELVQQLITMY